MSFKSVFVGVIPYEGKSEERVIAPDPPQQNCILYPLLLSVAPGDLLGIFSGNLRYVDRKPLKAIKGPVPGLWLDYSEILGKLNQMRVVKRGEKSNVYLAWEGVNEVKGEKSFCQYWKVLVAATREIMPFDELIRPP